MTHPVGKAGAAGKIYVQIGAGAGDRDARAQFRDGFCEFVKALPPAEVERIVLVEPNPFNIPALTECWKDYPQASIFRTGIVPKAFSGKSLNFFFAREDGPHYQVASIDPSHVLKHYPHLSIGDLEVVSISTIDLNAFLQQIVGAREIELLCLDIEGIDAEVLLDTDLSTLNANFISFEHLHLGAQQDDVVVHFLQSGYMKVGIGIDHNGFDWLYRKVR